MFGCTYSESSIFFLVWRDNQYHFFFVISDKIDFDVMIDPNDPLPPCLIG